MAPIYCWFFLVCQPQGDCREAAHAGQHRARCQVVRRYKRSKLLAQVVAGFMHSDINKVLKTLDEREQSVVRLRYGLDDGRPHTLDEIGRVFGISRERVRQIERDSMAKLRVGERSEALRAYAS